MSEKVQITIKNKVGEKYADLQTKIVTPSKETQVIRADEGYYGLQEVIVNPPEIDGEVLNENINSVKVMITDGTATAEDIKEGQTAYVNGEKIVGTSKKAIMLDSLISGTRNFEIESDVRYIREYAFYNCDKLTIANFPNVVAVYGYAFQRCSLEKIYAPKISTIKEYAFYECQNLISVDFPLVNNADSNIFGYCSKLKSVNLPLIGYIKSGAFASCSKLTDVNIPNAFDFSINSFADCSSLANIKLPKAKSFYYQTFADCTSLINIYLGYNGIVKINDTTVFNGVPKGLKVHVRSEYADQYATATNWSKLIADGTIVIVGDYSD